jgi:hypothetical protein
MIAIGGVALHASILEESSAWISTRINDLQVLNTEQADRVKNRTGEDLSRSVLFADRGKPRACQHSPGLLSAWPGADVGNFHLLCEVPQAQDRSLRLRTIVEQSHKPGLAPCIDA